MAFPIFKVVQIFNFDFFNKGNFKVFQSTFLFDKMFSKSAGFLSGVNMALVVAPTCVKYIYIYITYIYI